MQEIQERELDISVCYAYSNATKLNFSQISLLLDIIQFRVTESLSSVPKDLLQLMASHAKIASDALQAHADADADAHATSTATPLTQVESVPLTASEPKDNWVQCDECQTWHRVETLEDLPEQWFCANKGKSCRPPKEAHALWPASLAKRVIKYIMAWNGTPIKKISHYAALKMLAERKNMTLYELFKIKPWDYLPDKCRIYCRAGPQIKLGWLPMPFIY